MNSILKFYSITDIPILIHVAFSQFPDVRQVMLELSAMNPVSHVTFASEPNVELPEKWMEPFAMSGTSPQPVIHLLKVVRVKSKK